MDSIDIALGLLGIVASIAGYLLSAKDKAQQEEIKSMQEHIDELYAKHEVDVMALQELRIKLAGNHYEKVELDAKFDRLESTLKHGLDSLGTKFDKLGETLTTLLVKSHD